MSNINILRNKLFKIYFYEQEEMKVLSLYIYGLNIIFIIIYYYYLIKQKILLINKNHYSHIKFEKSLAVKKELEIMLYNCNNLVNFIKHTYLSD